MVSLGLVAAAGCDADYEEDVGEASERNLPPQLENALKKAFAKYVRGKAVKVGMKPMPAPPEVEPELFELGQALAFDKILSGNDNISCMTCHPPTLGTDDDRHLSFGEGGVGVGVDRTHPENLFHPRNTPPLFNLHAMDTLFWDARVSVHGKIESPADEELTPEMLEVLEFGAPAALALFPPTSRREMRGELGTNELSMIRDDKFQAQWAALMNKLGGVEEYVEMFEDAYPGTDFEDMSFAHAANAIAGFQIAAFPADDTPWDRFLRGDDDALSWEQLGGASLFVGRANCHTCHTGSSLTDLDVHNTALPQFGIGKGDGVFKDDDIGRAGETRRPEENYHFRTAPLRNIALTAPYGHAGQFAALEDFVAHYIDPEAALLNYDASQINPLLQPTLLSNHAEILATFDADEVTADIYESEVPLLVAFLGALTDERSLDLADTIPESVPSGLPIAETVVTEIENFAGTFTFEMGFNTSGGFEYQIWEESMCEGTGHIDVDFDRNAGTLDFHAYFDGLPYRPTVCYEYNPTTPWNLYPDCVEDGQWMIWFVGRSFTLRSLYYYDAVTGALIGNEHDVDELPPTAFPIELPTLQMVGSPLFESDPETLVSEFHWYMDYHEILDRRGAAGVHVGVVPKNIFSPEELTLYYTNGGLPAEMAMDFDDIMDDIADERGGMIAGLSYEPVPRPDYLLSRDNVMIGWGGQWPEPNPELIPAKPEGAECGVNFQWQGNYDPPPPEEP
ncbi:MAG: cytochrome c peroxidase [Nannocystaceae bacterium]